MCNRRSSWCCDTILKVLVCPFPCVLFCNGHQQQYVPDVELPLADVQEPEYEAGALSCQHNFFRIGVPVHAGSLAPQAGKN